MKNALYVSNLAPSVTEDTLREIFGQHGEVVSVSFGQNERFQSPYALVEMASEKTATKAMIALNGYEVEGHRLAVSYTGADYTREFTSKQRKAAEAIAEALGETDKIPVREIHTMVLLCGAAFATALVDEAKQIHANQGILTHLGDRPRTLGGVYFHLARARVNPEAYRIIFNRKGKLPNPTDTPEDADTAATAATESEGVS